MIETGWLRYAFCSWKVWIVLVGVQFVLLVSSPGLAEGTAYSKFEDSKLSHVEYRIIDIQNEHSAKRRFHRINSQVFKEHLKILKGLLSNQDVLEGFDRIRLEIQFLRPIMINPDIQEGEIASFSWRGGPAEGVLRAPWMQFSMNTNSKKEQTLNITVMVSDMQVIFDVYGLHRNLPALGRQLEYQRFARVFGTDWKYRFQKITETITPLSDACYRAMLRSYIDSVYTFSGEEVVKLYTNYPNCPTSGWRGPLLHMIKMWPEGFDWPHSAGIHRAVSRCVVGTTGFYKDLYSALISAGRHHLLKDGNAADEQWWRVVVDTTIALKKYRGNSVELCGHPK